jgi:hypothetical protein
MNRLKQRESTQVIVFGCFINPDICPDFKTGIEDRKKGANSNAFNKKSWGQGIN